MLSVLAVGISDYNNMDKNIACAQKDARTVYDTFQKIMEEEFSKYTSICIYNTTVGEIRNLLMSLENILEEKDIFVFYFSGHGEINGNTLDLCLGGGTDVYSRWNLGMPELLCVLGKFRCKVMIILDCCYSGAGINWSNIEEVYGNSNITIVSSSTQYSTATYSDDGSEFTKELCNALSNLYNNQTDISLSKIFNEMKKTLNGFYGQAKLWERQPDVILKRFFKDSEKVKNFSKEFVDRLKRVNFDTREFFWYSIIELPDFYKFEILNYYFNDKKVSSEPHWIVRRAVGSVISSIKDRKKAKDLLEKICRSENWMIRCIGYNGAKYDMDQSIEVMLKNEREKDNVPMDVIWLSNLYYFDRKDIEHKNFFCTNLMKSSWGIIDLWKRIPDSYFINKKLEKFKNNIDNEKYFDELKEYISYLEEDKQNFISYIFSEKKRGRLPVNTPQKWILSIIEGKWRDQTNLNLEEYLKNHKNPENGLLELKLLPFVELKMGVLDFFCKNPEYAEEYKKYLVWALEDEHPWVVRTALPIFKNDKDCFKKIDIKKYDRTIYPGVFDLLLEMAKYKIDVTAYVKKDGLNLTKQEQESLEWAVSMEK